MRKLTDLSLALAVFSSLCYGGGNETDTSSESLSQYEAKLAQAPPIIQVAMNDNHIQYMDGDFIKSARQSHFIKYPYTLTAVPTKISPNEIYSFLTAKLGDKIVLEAVYGWQNNVYSSATRQISSDSSINEFNFIDNVVESPNIKLNGLTYIFLKDMTTLLFSGKMTVNCNFEIIGDQAHFSNITCTVGDTTKTLSDFNVLYQNETRSEVLINICHQFLTQ